MFWADQLADEIIRRKPDKEEYVCAAGISPSGSVHIGNFRDIATSFFVCRALQKKGKKAKLLFSWDEFDRLRKVPKNVADRVGDNSFEQYIGYPYVDIPDPFGEDESYAAHFEKEFMTSVERFGISMEYRYQAKEYRSGRYAESVILALRKRKEIFDILDRHRTQDATTEEREQYYPVSIFCPHCHKDSTKITALSEDCTRAHYVCACGEEGDFDFTKDFNCKLQWKVDWPMRWKVEGVDFEPGGKDHASKNGSYDTAKDVSREIFGYEPPLFQGYEFIGIKGSVGKMSGSSGMNMTPDFLLHLYLPEMILWLYAKTDPLKAFDFCLSDEILRQYFEFGKMLKAYQDGTADESTRRIIEDCMIGGRKLVAVPMSQLVELGSVVDFNAEMMEKLFEKIGTPYKVKDFRELFDKAKFWLKTCSPESEYVILSKRNWPYYRTMNEQERACVRQLKEYIARGGYTLDSLQAELYAIPKRVFPDKAEDKNALKAVQSKFFQDIYQLILGRERGPRLYLYLFAVEPERYLHLLDFSLPENEDPDAVQAEAEETPATVQAEAPAEDRYVEKPAAFREWIDLSDFERCDIRVCKVLSAKPMRKTNKLMKLTLHDGVGERVIVSSIADQYEPEDLVGKKIIVLVNLRPHKFGNEYSNGMLLASGNTDGSCRVLFAAEDAQIGSLVH